MPEKKKKTPPIVAPSLMPRKTTKKVIPGSENRKKEETTKVQEVQIPKATPKKNKVEQSTVALPKERFTLWISRDVYNAFKIHTATRKGSASDYIESLIRKDLNL